MADDNTALKADECTIHAPIESIFRAFVDAATLREWLDLDLDLILELGGKYVLSRGDEVLFQGTIEVLAWPEALSVKGGEGHFDLTLVPDFGGTSVRLSSKGIEVMRDALAKLEKHMVRAGRR